jgi:hypothetical protein
MNFPFVLGIVVGLVFIYLILSLFASELQEIYATVFQWRAKHLKYSIENLLAGDERTSKEIDKAKKIVDRLYNDPLLKNVNQEARGAVEKAFRKLTWRISELYRWLARKEEGVFGNHHSGPSYITSETFATTLIETLKISVLVENLIELRLENFANRIIKEIEYLANKLDKNISNEENINWLKDDFSNIVEEFKNNKSNLSTSIDKLSEGLDRYIEAYHEDEFKDFRSRGAAFKQSIFGANNERAILSGGLKTSLTEIIATIDIGSNIHKEIKEAMMAKDSETYEKISEVLNDLPISLKDSLGILARRAQTRVQQSENELNQLREEISIWFDRSMERASGVYKRNAKGVAILIGFFIAFATNADTFHIFNRLSSDENLRKVVTERASQVRLGSANSGEVTQELEDLKYHTNQVLKDISLPLSWNPPNLGQQFNCSPSITSTTQNNDDSQGWAALFNKCIPGNKASATFFIPQKIAEIMITHPWLALKMILGWFLSGIAIAMGAPFWFDLLGKVVNVRNSGNQPPSAANQANPQ